MLGGCFTPKSKIRLVLVLLLKKTLKLHIGSKNHHNAEEIHKIYDEFTLILQNLRKISRKLVKKGVFVFILVFLQRLISSTGSDNTCGTCSIVMKEVLHTIPLFYLQRLQYLVDV